MYCSKAWIRERCNWSPLCIAGNKAASSSSFSSSKDSMYTLRKPSKMITSPTASNVYFSPEIAIVIVVFSSSASAI